MKYGKEEKAKNLEEWKHSGKSAWAYAKGAGINQQTFAKWVKTERESKSDFVEIKNISAANNTTSISESRIVLEKEEIKIHIPLYIGKEEICSLIKSIKTVI